MTSRRRFLQGVAAAGAWGVLRPDQMASALGAPSTLDAATALPDPATAPFDHVVVLMFENRSFDHILGWLPGADGVQAGRHYTDQLGVTYPTYPLGRDTRAAATSTPTTRGRGSSASTTGARSTGGCARPPRGAPPTPSRSATTGPRTSRARQPGQLVHGAGPVLRLVRRARRSRTASTSTRRAPIATTTSGSTDHDLGPTIWDRLAAAGRDRRRTTSSTSPSSRCGARSTCRSCVRSRSSSSTPPRARCRT